MPLLLQFIQLYFKFAFQQFHRAVGTYAKHFRNPDEQRSVIFNYTAQWRNGSFASRECVKSINGFIGRNAAGQMDLDFHFGSGVVLYLFDFYFSFVIRFQNSVNQR